MGRASALDELDATDRVWLDTELIAGNFTGYEALAETLRARGYRIGKSSIHRYGSKIERRLAAVKASTEAAKLIAEGAGDDQDARSEAVIALVQTELFETIVNLQEAGDEGIDQVERAKLLSSVAKNIATLARASVTVKKYAQAVKERAQSAAAEVAKVARKGGLSEEAIRAIEQQVLGIV